MNKLKFFIFAYWHDPRWDKFVGATVKVWDLAHNLSLIGHDVILFLPKYHFKKKEIPFKIVEIPFIDFPGLRLLSFNLLLLLSLLFFFRKQKPNVVYVRRMTSLVPLLYAVLRKAKYFYEINDDPYEKERNEGTRMVFLLRSKLSTKIDEINLKYCHKATVITEEIKEKIVRYNPTISPRKMAIIHSGANTDIFRPLDLKLCRSYLNLDSSIIYIGFVGSLLKHQGVDVLIRAANQILERLRNCKFIIIGEGPMKKSLQNFAKTENLDSNFFFTGQISYTELPKWIGSMNLCVAPFKRSAGLRSPVKVFDYLACGKPVVASKIYGTTDIFQNCGAINMVEPENADELANTIINLLGDKEKIKQMGKHGRKYILSHYSRKKIAKKIADDAEKLVTTQVEC